MYTCKHSDARKLMKYFKSDLDIPLKIATYVIDRIPNGWLSLNDDDPVTFYISGEIRNINIGGNDGIMVGSCVDDKICVYIDELLLDTLDKFENHIYKFI